MRSPSASEIRTTSSKRARRGLAAAVAVSAVAALGTTPAAVGATAGAQPAAQPSAGGGASAATVVKTSRVVPARRKVVRKRFRPWAKPSQRKVRKIIRLEARRAGISSGRLARRVGCESGFRWYAGNGQYRGLLQFASSTFQRGLRTIRSRNVLIVHKRKRTVREIKRVHYSDGRVVRKRGRKRSQIVTYVYRGKLPRRPATTHAWTQLRIGAQAIRGRSAVSSGEWACPA